MIRENKYINIKILLFCYYLQKSKLPIHFSINKQL